MAVSAWNEIITELRVDRGMLLGNTQYSEMTGVERVKALDAIDDSIKTANEWVSYYAHERDKVQGGIRNIFKTRKIRRMTDEELGEV